MPTYQYTCPECAVTADVLRGISDKSPENCKQCGKPMTRDFVPGGVGHVRGSTPAKGYKESRLRVKRNADLGVRQIERHGSGPSIIPNVDGVETGSWAEAAKLAKESGKRTALYNEMAEKEKHRDNSRGLDERKWKKLKEEKRLLG